MKLLLSIRSLNIGGAERQFVELLKHIDKEKFDITVCTMYGGAQEDIVKNIPNLKYINLKKSGRYDLWFYFKYKKLLREINPEVIYSFMSEMNLFSYWCKPKNSKIVWGFRASNMDLKQYGKVPQILFWLQKKLSNKVDKIIANSNASIEFHKNSKFNMQRSVVIYNGINTKKFKRDNEARDKFRKKYNLKDGDIAIGIIARIDYMKGYIVFSKAAKNILDKFDNIYFFSAGGGEDSIRKESQDILNQYNQKKFFWLGNQKDVQNIYSGLDISSSSSFGEGFSNSIAEAMSCELPCVVTNVGDSKMIIGDTGVVVEPNNIKSLCEGLEEIINRDLKVLGLKSRERIVKNFSIDKMVKETENELVKCVE